VIAVDTSALMAIVADEREADRCQAVLETEPLLVISAATLAEAMIVATRRDLRQEMAKLMASLGFEIVPVTEASARSAAAAYDRWGKGIHPAALNFGDCFAYALAKERACELLFIGNDFSRTDVKSALKG
jgi:ribonuclease VapC